jgi:porphobilinogen synthase
MLDLPVPGPERLVWPVFLVPGKGIREPISELPGICRHSPDRLAEILEPVVAQGVGGILLFGAAPAKAKDAQGSFAVHPGNPVLQALPLLRKRFPGLLLATDVCLCPYTSHGGCGVLDGCGTDIDNDATLPLLAAMAAAHAAAGAHLVAPSAMMDGQVAALRARLDEDGHTGILTMSYAVKFASSLYGPFRAAMDSTPARGDRRTCQAAPGNLRAALREAVLDEAEGADILMVKPALPYLDVLSRLRATTDLPLAAYQVSGEYAMLAALAEKGLANLPDLVRESMVAMSRAGADIIITYWADRHRTLMGEAT